MFRKIGEYKTPRDKLISLINGCKLISSMAAEVIRGKERKIAGADDILPLLIYCVAKAKPTAPWTNIQFMRSFRDPEKVKGFEEYCLTSYEICIGYLDELKWEKVKISPEEMLQRAQKNSRFQDSTRESIEEVFTLQSSLYALKVASQKKKNEYLIDVKKNLSEKVEIGKKMKNGSLKFFNKNMNTLFYTDVPMAFKEYQNVTKNYFELIEVVQSLIDNFPIEETSQPSNLSENTGASKGKEGDNNEKEGRAPQPNN